MPKRRVAKAVQKKSNGKAKAKANTERKGKAKVENSVKKTATKLKEKRVSHAKTVKSLPDWFKPLKRSGWTRVSKIRKSGASSGQLDFYYFCPKLTARKFRSRLYV